MRFMQSCGHYLIDTERSYCDWIKRFVYFHNMKSRDDLQGGKSKIEQFITHLAVKGNVSPTTQTQAMNALVTLHEKDYSRIRRRLSALRSGA